MRLTINFNYFLTISFFLLLLSIIVISSSLHPLKFDYVKLNLLTISFNLMVFNLPLNTSIIFIILFSFMTELLSDSPPGFFVLLHLLTFPLVVFYIRKNLYTINFMTFFIFLVITGVLKVVFENILMYFIYDVFYYFLFKISIEEYLTTVIVSMFIFATIKILKGTAQFIHYIWLRLKHL